MSKHTLINVDGPELKFTRGPDPDDEKSVVTLSSTTTFGTSATGFRDSQEIRSRLLSRLGIYDAPPGMAASASATHQPMTAAQHRRARILRGMGVGYTVFKSPPDGSAHRTPLGGVTPSKEPLKTGESSSSLSSSRRHHKKSNSTGALYSDVSTNSKSTRIMFQDEVEVMPIPTRHEYSDRIKSRIWSNRHELQENAERNAVEFATEGWNWRTVTEDEGMYICSLSGEFQSNHDPIMVLIFADAVTLTTTIALISHCLFFCWSRRFDSSGVGI